jgi:hypothetical protein
VQSSCRPRRSRISAGMRHSVERVAGERAPRKGRQHLSAADRRRRQKTMDRQLASARRTKFADHQRAARRYPLEQLVAHRCAPCVAEITQCSSLFNHDNPPFTTGSQNRDIIKFASQMCEHAILQNIPPKIFCFSPLEAGFPPKYLVGRRGQTAAIKRKQCSFPCCSRRMWS